MGRGARVHAAADLPAASRHRAAASRRVPRSAGPRALLPGALAAVAGQEAARHQRAEPHGVRGRALRGAVRALAAANRCVERRPPPAFPPHRVRRMTGLANPALVFTVLWGLVLGLTHLRLTSQLLDLNRPTLLLVGANILSIWVIYLLSLVLMRGRVNVWEARAGGLDMPVLRRMVNGLLKFWAAGTVVEIIVSGGI